MLTTSRSRYGGLLSERQQKLLRTHLRNCRRAQLALYRGRSPPHCISSSAAAAGAHHRSHSCRRLLVVLLGGRGGQQDLLGHQGALLHDQLPLLVALQPGPRHVILHRRLLGVLLAPLLLGGGRACPRCMHALRCCCHCCDWAYHCY